ncbi:MAG: hypothetical protein L7F78_06545, partial [Syntrophales bacterium LBB04]|nr:hypothetical protein [Syntrophales bacterium LBB04]
LRLIAKVLLGLVITIANQFYWTGMCQGVLAQIFADPGFFIRAFLTNFSLSFQSLIWVLLPGNMLATAPIYQMLQPIVQISAMFIFLITTFFFIWKVKRREISFYGCFSYAYLILLIVWASFAAGAQDYSRFVLPIIGFVGLIFVRGLMFLGQKTRIPIKIFVSGGLGILIVLNAFNIAAHYRFNDDVLYRKNNRELFAWIRNNTKSDDHFMFWKPTAITLMTGRMGTVPAMYADQKADLGKRINDFKIKYVILAKADDAELISLFQSAPGYSDIIWENPAYKIFKLAEDARFY